MESDVEKIKERLSIQEVVSQYVQLKRAGKNWGARCPFHKERTPSFYVSPERGTYMCFGCGERGDIFSFVQKIEGVDFPTALKQLAARAGVTLERGIRVRSEEEVEKGERLLDACEAATNFFTLELSKRKDVMSYLQARGLREEIINEWRLGYAPASWEALSGHLLGKGFSKEEIVEAGLAKKSERKEGEVFDRFRGRIMFPISDSGSRVIAFSGRFFENVPGQKTEGEPAKYVNSPETPIFRKSKVLYGLERAKNYIRKADCVLLVEGQMDLLLAHQSGLPFSVALSGTALTPEHLNLLSRLSKRLVLSFDADSAGLRAGLRSTHLALLSGFDVKIPTLPSGKDPADLAKENPELLKAAVRTSQTAIEFFLNALWPTARDERSYKRLVEAQVLPLIAAMHSRIEQAHFIQIVSARLGVPESAVRSEVEKLLQGKGPSAPEEALPEPPQTLPPLERTAGMLIFYFRADEAMQTRLRELLGPRYKRLQEELSPQAEDLRFRFEIEVGEHTDAATIAGDLLRQLEILLIDEEISNARGDAKRITELARRKHDLLK